MDTTQNGSLTERFSAYFDREVAQKAAGSLGNGVQILFQIDTEHFTFTKVAGRNRVVAGAAQDPELVFTLTAQAAEAILADPSDDVGAIGVHIAKLIVSPDANKRVSIKFKVGFLKLFSKGYFGVITAGGSQFASYLASRGLNGMSAIKTALKKIKE